MYSVSLQLRCSLVRPFFIYVYIRWTGNEARQTSKEQTNMPRFILEGPRPCAIFWFPFLRILCMSFVTNWLLPRSVVNSYCVLSTVKAKKEQKHTTKNFVEFHNYSFLLTMDWCLVYVFQMFSFLWFPRSRRIQFDKAMIVCKEEAKSASTTTSTVLSCQLVSLLPAQWLSFAVIMVINLPTSLKVVALVPHPGRGT